MRRLSILLVSAAMALTLIALAVVTGASAAVRASDAQGQKGSGQQITLEHGGNADFQRKLSEATNQNGFEPKIVGGTPVPDGKYPFMVFIQVETSDGSIFSCGGSLIDPNSVLTAAHCFPSSEMTVNVGVGGTVLSEGFKEVRLATAASLHPLYDGSKNSSNDVAVLTLESAVRGIKPIRLATPRQNALEKPGRRLTVAGWGNTSEGGTGSDRMREVSLPVVSDAKARKAYSSQTPDLRYFPSVMVAAAARGKDSCQGDSGGPLFKPGSIRTQVGVVSYGLGCARAGFPGAYTEVNNPGIKTFIRNAAK